MGTQDQSIPLLEIHDLAVQRGDLEVIKGLSFKVSEGEVFGLIGPNGSGKSSTFSVLTGLLSPQAGSILLRGKQVTGGSQSLRRELGVVFQNPSLDPHMSARENLELSARLYRVPRAESLARIQELLRFADLVDRADERVSTFSGGMKPRLELARSLIHEPKILLMDEPTTGLDEAAFQRTWKRLLRLRDERGVSILLSTHRPEEAAFCDRIAFINDGGLVACDTPKALQEQVSGDRLLIQCQNPEPSRVQLETILSLQCEIVDGGLSLHCDEGHTLIPRIVEALPEGEIRSAQLLRPNLGDVFLKLTGQNLLEDA